MNNKPHKYSVEYIHNMKIIDYGSALRSRIMICKDCYLSCEISDGHIKYRRHGVIISRCHHEPLPGGGTQCIGWPDIPECEENMIKVSNSVKVYEVDGKEIKSLDYPQIKVDSHWNRNEFIVLQSEDGKKYTVCSRDLIAAIENATNINRYG